VLSQVLARRQDRTRGDNLRGRRARGLGRDGAARRVHRAPDGGVRQGDLDQVRLDWESDRGHVEDARERRQGVAASQMDRQLGRTHSQGHRHHATDRQNQVLAQISLLHTVNTLYDAWRGALGTLKTVVPTTNPPGCAVNFLFSFLPTSIKFGRRLAGPLQCIQSDFLVVASTETIRCLVDWRRSQLRLKQTVCNTACSEHLL
jgi:hypothetical protein